ncbi:unnamed protein product [Gongylonema pulchrum]|uniref:OTU domain-containing protein n=1 Tax=Gongylonema pulchrum TaxID=637853 RepID=A0A183E6G2_9BILA|nr:unnamed protein product [Gongylonema pulchrum]
MKHSVAKCDKKRKREVAAEITKLEEEMKNRHEKELAELQSFSPSKNVEESADTENQSPNQDTKPQRVSRAQKRREKKAELNRKLEEAAEADKTNAKSTRRKLEMDAIERILSERGLVMHEIPPDGDCLYSSLAHQLSIVSEIKARQLVIVRITK